jgi:hypothetical protein
VDVDQAASGQRTRVRAATAKPTAARPAGDLEAGFLLSQDQGEFVLEQAAAGSLAGQAGQGLLEFAPVPRQLERGQGVERVGGLGDAGGSAAWRQFTDQIKRR